MDTFLPSLIASLALGWPVYFALRASGVVDKPNARSSHSVPTVRGGGVAIILTILGAVVFQAMRDRGCEGSLIAVALAVLGLAVVSFIDDLRSVPALLRFGAHGAAAALVLIIVGIPENAASGGPAFALAALWTLIGFLWIAGYTNAFNFMDGINGIAAGQATVTGLATAALALIGGLPPAHPAVWLAAAAAGAAAGFLPHNFPRARMFMGDVSSAPLGFLLAALGWWLVRDTAWWMLVPLGLLHANFVLDTGVTLARRLLCGERWYQPHREHFYQRLVRAGRGHAEVTGLEMGLQLLAAVGVLLAVKAHSGVWLAVVAVAVVAMWALFFLRAERIFRRAEAGKR
jgi:UDP-N-acetylmuramyl pentapeptide phosphotransferase/UDP-N-acetylglucosamine-1-phosphate transferase